MEPSTEEYLDKIRKEHQENPQDFFVEILQIFWGDRSEEETRMEWLRHCKQVRWYAEDVLQCLETILHNPPGNLAELMQEEGSIMLNSGSAPYTVLSWYRQQYYEFLQRIYSEFRTLFENTALD